MTGEIRLLSWIEDELEITKKNQEVLKLNPIICILGSDALREITRYEHSLKTLQRLIESNLL